MKLRPPRPGDETALAQLSDQLGYPSDAAQVRQRLDGILPRDDQRVIVAEDDRGHPLGWIHVLMSYRLESDAAAEIAGLVVSETYRSAGIGLALLEAAEAWADERGVSVVRVRSNVIRERAHGFYLRHGYALRKTSRVFEKRLEQREEETGA
jgi:GNAT superfamily N-acetyltransferase